MIIHEIEKIPRGIEKKIIIDSKKAFIPITSYTLVNGCIDDYFYKKINMDKVKKRYSGNYADLLLKYYKSLSRCIKCNQLCALILSGNDLFEISKKIESDEILCDNRVVTYKEIKDIFINALIGIKKLENSNDRNIGIDSSIWNYTKRGIFFDYDPPKILGVDTLFTVKGDLDQEKRTMYRSFDYIGMRMNSLATIILGNSAWNFKIENLPENYIDELIDIMFESINDLDKINDIKKQIYGEEEMVDFSNHPINIIRKELNKNGK